MPSSTPRLGLTLPLGTELIAPVPPGTPPAINTNFTTLDAAVGFPLVTSTTKPTSPYDLQTVYETDTGLVALYDATNGWQRYSSQSTYRLINNVSSGAAQVVTVPKGTETLIFTGSWSVPTQLWNTNTLEFMIRMGWQLRPLTADNGNVRLTFNLKFGTAPVTLATGTISTTSATCSGVTPNWGSRMAFIDRQAGAVISTVPTTLYVGISAIVNGGNAGVNWQSTNVVGSGMNNYLNVYGN